MFTFIRVFLCLFAAVTLGGGIVGFAKAASKASLIAGGTAAALLLASAWLLGTSNPTLGLILGALISLALAARFVPAYRKSRKLMPAGLMVGLSIASLLLSSLGLLGRRRLEFARAVETADSAFVFEGLPHAGIERELYAQERAKPVKELLGYPFYEGAMELNPEDLAAVQAILAEPGTYEPLMGMKACGGFHPDWAFEWTRGSDRFLVLVCLGCREVKLLGPAGDAYHDLSRVSFDSLKTILRPYRKNRPKGQLYF